MIRDCLLKADNSATGVGDVIYFPEFQLAHRLVSGENFRSRAELSSAVFYPYARLEDKTTENCVITNNVDKPVSGFDVDGVPGTGSADKTDAVTVTISRGFIAAEDRLYIDNATFTSSTNTNTGDTIHTYTNVSSSNTNRFPERHHRQRHLQRLAGIHAGHEQQPEIRDPVGRRLQTHQIFKRRDRGQ